MSGLSEFASHWPGAFALTQLVEVPVYVATLAAPAGPLRDRALAGFATSAITHPLLWLALPATAALSATCGDLPAGDALGACYERLTHGAELAIWLTEAALLRFMLRVGPVRSLLAALAANGASYLLGLAIHAAA